MGNQYDMLLRLKQKRSSRLFLIFESLIVGIVTGIVISFFRISIDYISSVRVVVYRFISLQSPVYLLLPLIGLCAVGLFVGFIIMRYPMIKGSGVAQVEGVFMQKLHLSPWPELPLKFLGGILGIGLGISVGREGPSVHIGAYIGDAAEKIGERSLMERVCLITAGAAAGLAATFNAPFAGVMFALEDLHQYFSPLLLVCIMTAAVAADFVAGAVFGTGPLFHFHDMPVFPLENYLWLIGLGIFVACIGHVFKKSIYFFQGMYEKLCIPLQYRPVIPFVLAVPAGLWFGYVSGGGDELIEALIEQQFTVMMMIGLLIVKIIFTGISAGSGTVGGIFVPLLACGSLGGVLYARFLSAMGLLDPAYTSHLLLFGMAACFATVIKAPLTACIIVFETSGILADLGGVILSCLSAYVTADMLGSQAHDHVVLSQLLNEDSVPAAGLGRNRKEMFEFPVQPLSYVSRKYIKDIEWPSDCLIIGVIRGDHELIPDGNTLLYPGDKLIILTENGGDQTVHDEVRRLTT